MKSRVSERGYGVVPSSIVKRLGMKPGDSVEIDVNTIRIAISAIKRKSRSKARIVTDKITGMPVLTLGRGAPVLTSEEVKDLLADFP